MSGAKAEEDASTPEVEHKSSAAPKAKASAFSVGALLQSDVFDEIKEETPEIPLTERERLVKQLQAALDINEKLKVSNDASRARIDAYKKQQVKQKQELQDLKKLERAAGVFLCETGKPFD